MSINVIPVVLIIIGILIVLAMVFFTDRMDKILISLGIYAVFAVCAVIFVSLFNSKGVVANELKQYEVVEASLGVTGKQNVMPTYLVSYKDTETGEIKVIRCHKTYQTDGQSYVSLCKFEYAGFYRYDYVYYKSMTEVDNGQYISSR